MFKKTAFGLVLSACALLSLGACQCPFKSDCKSCSTACCAKGKTEGKACNMTSCKEAAAK